MLTSIETDRVHELPALKFITHDMSLEEQVDEWNEQYIKLYHQLLSERQEWQIEKNQGLALIGDYRRDNQQLESEKRQWEQEREFGFKLVENLKARVEHYQNKVKLIQEMYNIDVDRIGASPSPHKTQDDTPGQADQDASASQDNNIQVYDPSTIEFTTNNEYLDDTETQEKDKDKDKTADENEQEEDELNDPKLDDKAKAILWRQRRESEYLRKECQALEDELRALQEEMQKKDVSEGNTPMTNNSKNSPIKSGSSQDKGRDSQELPVYVPSVSENRVRTTNAQLLAIAEQVPNEELIERINEAWEEEVAALLESIANQESGVTPGGPNNAGAQTPGVINEEFEEEVFQEWQPYEASDTNESHMDKMTKHMSVKTMATLHHMRDEKAKENQKSQMKRTGHLTTQLPDSRMIFSSMDDSDDDTAAYRNKVHILEGQVSEMKEEMSRIKQSKIELVASTCQSMDDMRQLLKAYNPDFKYRRILDKLFEDDRYKKLLDKINESADNETNPNFNEDLDQLLIAISHLRDTNV